MAGARWSLMISAVAVVLTGGRADAQSANSMAEVRSAIQVKDYDKAISLLKPLADAGNPEAEKQLGALYFKGIGTSADSNRALKLFLAAAKTGDPDAEKDVGIVYQTGPADLQNDAEAVKWFRAAAEQGNSEAQSLIGFMYRNGRGVARDPKEALRWTVKAAEQGHAVALANVGTQFADGFGLPQNYALALFWLDVALLRMPNDNPSRPAHQRYADNLATHLSANDVQRVSAAARNWTPGKGALDNVLAMASLPGNGSGQAPKPAAGSGKKTGSGFVINTAGDVLTNNHVIDGCTAILTHVANGEPVKATPVATDRSGDLAVLRPAGLLGEPVVLRDRSARQGERIMVAGFPLVGMLTTDMSVTEGIVSALSGAGDNTRQIQISAPIQSGNSGGPVFDADGAVIGVVQSAINGGMLGVAGTISQNANFAIKVTSVREFLDAKSIGYESGAATKLHGSLPDRARRSTIAIECTH
ncbi:MAG TPA: tetratricopeptide repeat-containing serine protease family protein [Aliidongia sp.]|nr:tetratricopeptide repeat-containing serine protease family protein [Aliidongia sp.]